MVVQIRLRLSEHERMRGVLTRSGAVPTLFEGWHNLVALLERLRAESERYPDDATSQLTVRERTVIAHVASGLSDQAIAQALGLSHRTVASHIYNAQRKLVLPRDEAYNRRVLAAISYLGEIPCANKQKQIRP
jgi:DNA-binding CsgD family transcriptional regulator